MEINMRTLIRILGKVPAPKELIATRRHYCRQMFLNSLCTGKCQEQCSVNLTRAFEKAEGEFIINPAGVLVTEFRQIVNGEVEKKQEKIVSTPKNELGEEVPELDVFAQLAKLYER